jgi:hypothetical protein
VSIEARIRGLTFPRRSSKPETQKKKGMGLMTRKMHLVLWIVQGLLALEFLSPAG